MQVNSNPTAAKIQNALAPITQAANSVNTAIYGAPPSAMGTNDSYQGTYTAPTPGAKVPLYQFFDDTMRPPHPLNYKIANRLSIIGVNDSESFLKVANTPFKRKMISYLGAGLFLNKQDRQYVDYQLSAWAGQADIMRAGADLQTARLAQVSGAGDVSIMSRYRNPVDKGVLYAAMAANALQYGYHMPSFGQVSQLIDAAAQTPPVVRWN